MPILFTRRPPQQQKTRNRGFLLASLEAGLQVRPVTQQLYLVESSKQNGAVYPLAVSYPTPPDPGDPSAPTQPGVTFRCPCEWGSKTAQPWHVGSAILPCRHQLLVFWSCLPAARQTALYHADPALAAAVEAGLDRQTTAPPLPADRSARIVPFPTTPPAAAPAPVPHRRPTTKAA